ncbi:uncharacterized protein K02A2.6-like isoform X2 [Pantherophis guttatus]|uniref:Gypsy retrotransposon integrase-like protein 1 n=1 Tax=Pantherophis guttatus TaxID=94885 RepID=A0ABM3Z5Z6_PANGU|nr:uncharacterized protein K02A2.6-like isoform X2 [Pantherophis guttatus]
MASAEVTLPALAPFRPGKDKWKSYVVKFRQYLRGNNIRDADDDRKKGIFLANCGSEVLDMAIDLVAPRDIEEVPWTDLLQILEEHYAPTGTPVANRFTFHQRDQKEGETIKEFVAALRQIAASCEFDHVDNAIADRVVFGMRDRGLQKKFLSRKKLVLKDVVEEATASEISEKAAAAVSRAKGIHKIRSTTQSSTEDSAAGSESEEESTVHKVSRPPRRETAQKSYKGERCASCRGDHPRASCKWRDATCRRCNRRGHIAEACRAEEPAPEPSSHRPRENREDNARASRRSSYQSRRGESDGNRRRAVHQTTIHLPDDDDTATKCHATVLLEGTPCSMEVDSGSVYSIMDWKNLKRIKPDVRKKDLRPLRSRLVDFGGNHIGVLGRALLHVSYQEFQGNLPITIVEHDRPTLLGMEWFKPLGLGIVGVNQIRQDELDTLLEEFKEVFDGKLGKFVGKPISFNLDKTITPIRLKPRRVPFALRPKVDAQLDKLIAQGVLEPIDHAAWETPIVTPMKHDGSVRICADYKCSINKALSQSAYPVPVVQHLLHSLGSGTIFAKLDLAQAYQQLPVDEKTAEAQTIVTHRGAFKCNRLQFGVSAAPGIFQSMMERLLQGIPGVVPYFDDVLISGHSKTQLLERLKQVLRRFKEKGLRVRRDKCIIGVQEVEFLGYLIDGTGIHPTKAKVRAIHEAPAPKNKAELQAFLGLLNFYAVFLKQKATAAEPLHRLLGKAVPWRWGTEEENAFKTIKGLLSSDSVLIQYHETLPLLLTCDASPYGIGAVLSHQLPNGSEAPIAYFSKTMSSTERNYSQLDKEALAIVAGVKRFHEYLYGRNFTVITDHKPLLGLLAGDKPTPGYMSPRMTRWAIFLAGYAYRLIHKPGKTIGNADALSRCPSKEPVEDPAPTISLLHIDADRDCPVTSADVATHTQRDPILKQVRSWVLRGWPAEKPAEKFSPFARKQQELSTMKGCILWGDRVLIPSALQKKTLETLHNGHPGIVRMKGLARSYVWWPSLDKDIEEWVARCDPCQEVRPAPAQTPVSEWEMPSSPWARIHIDFAGPMQGHYLLIVVDAFSKWLEVIPMASTTSEATIRALRRLFATHGLPDVLVSDNGPQLTSKAMEEFLAGLGIRHALTAFYRPAGNGQAERMVRLTKETLTKMGPGDWQERIDNFLLTQHITPHATTKKSPAELLMGRRLRSPLDRLHPQYNPEVTATASRPLRAFTIGDPVFALNFNGSPKWLKGRIESTTGPKSYRVELEDGQVCRRHIDQLRKRWRGSEGNQPDGVGLPHPDEVGLQHPDEVGLQHPGRADLQHSGEVGLPHPDEAGLQHPGEAGHRPPDEAGQAHSHEIPQRRSRAVDRDPPREGGSHPSSDEGQQRPCQGDQRSRQVDRGQPHGGGAQQATQAGQRPTGKGDPNQHPDRVDQHQPCKVDQHHSSKEGAHHPGQVEQHHPSEVGQHQPCEASQLQPSRGDEHHPGEVDHTGQRQRREPNETPTDLPGFGRHPPDSSVVPPRGSRFSRRGKDQRLQRELPDVAAGGAGTDPAHSTAGAPATPTGEPGRTGASPAQAGGEAQTELRRSSRASRRPAYLRDFVTYINCDGHFSD